MAQDSSLSPKRDINAVLAAHDKQLLAIPDVVGVYVSVLPDGRKIPRSIEGYPVVVEVTGEIRALDNPPGERGHRP